MSSRAARGLGAALASLAVAVIAWMFWELIRRGWPLG